MDRECSGCVSCNTSDTDTTDVSTENTVSSTGDMLLGVAQPERLILQCQLTCSSIDPMSTHME